MWDIGKKKKIERINEQTVWSLPIPTPPVSSCVSENSEMNVCSGKQKKGRGERPEIKRTEHLRKDACKYVQQDRRADAWERLLNHSTEGCTGGSVCVVTSTSAACWGAAPQLLSSPAKTTLLLWDVFETVCDKESETHTLTHHRQKWIFCVLLLSTFTPLIHYGLTWAAPWAFCVRCLVKFTFCAPRLRNQRSGGTLLLISESFPNQRLSASSELPPLLLSPLHLTCANVSTVILICVKMLWLSSFPPLIHVTLFLLHILSLYSLSIINMNEDHGCSLFYSVHRCRVHCSLFKHCVGVSRSGSETFTAWFQSDLFVGLWQQMMLLWFISLLSVRPLVSLVPFDKLNLGRALVPSDAALWLLLLWQWSIRLPLFYHPHPCLSPPFVSLLSSPSFIPPVSVYNHSSSNLFFLLFPFSFYSLALFSHSHTSAPSLLPHLLFQQLICHPLLSSFSNPSSPASLLLSLLLPPSSSSFFSC